MNFLFLCILLTSKFLFSYQLICWEQCWKFNISTRKEFYPLRKLTNDNSCRQQIRLNSCYAQIHSWYTWDNLGNFLSYSLGPQEHIIEKEIERLMEINRWTFVIYCLFIFDWEKSQNIIITTSILCRNRDNCALIYLEYFYEFYRQQINLIDHFEQFFVQHQHIQSIHCYDKHNHRTIQCPTSEYPRCIKQLSHQFEQQSCYSDPRRQIEYAFVISSNNHSLEKLHQLIICDTNNCNDPTGIQAIEKLIYKYTLGKNFSIDMSNDGSNVLMQISLFQMIEFSLMILKMIF